MFLVTFLPGPQKQNYFIWLFFITLSQPEYRILQFLLNNNVVYFSINYFCPQPRNQIQRMHKHIIESITYVCLFQYLVMVQFVMYMYILYEFYMMYIYIYIYTYLLSTNEQSMFNLLFLTILLAKNAVCVFLCVTKIYKSSLIDLRRSAIV